jgi:hypothetical protein
MSSTLDRLLGKEDLIEPTHEIPEKGHYNNDKLPFSHMGNLMKRRQELSQKSFSPVDPDGEATSRLSSRLDFDWDGQSSSSMLRKMSGGTNDEE